MTASYETSQGSDSDISFEIPPFAATCLEAASEYWKASFEHAFVSSLLDGSLSEERFRYYQMQDARYLEVFADSCSLISVRFAEPDRKLWFIDAARLAIVVERELHEEYGRRFGYTARDIADLELSPNNRAYQNHLLISSQQGTMLEAVAAITPCPWLYADIGKRFAHLLNDISADHPYADWLRTYADPSFVTYANELMQHLQFLADRNVDPHQQKDAIDAFVLSTRYEVMFWEQAWQEQDWTLTTDNESAQIIEDAR